jgi:PilZ domain
MSAADLLPPDEAGHVLFRCPGCGFDIECLAADADRYAKVGCPLCGGPVEPADAPPAEEPEPGESLPARNKRLTQRRLVRGGARAEIRKGMMGLGKDLAVGLADLCEDGLGVRLKTAVKPKDECEVMLHRPGGGKPVKMAGEFRWCAPLDDGTFRVGIRFQKRLARVDLLALVR